MSPDILLPPHGPDHADGCLPCERMRRFTGHVSLPELRRRRAAWPFVEPAVMRERLTLVARVSKGAEHGC